MIDSATMQPYYALKSHRIPETTVWKANRPIARTLLASNME